MKFTDGYWKIRAGLTAYFPAHVHAIDREPAAMTVYGPTRKLRDRADTLDQPLVTVRYSSPMDNVIRVQVCHHTGAQRRRPEFALLEQPAPAIQVIETDQAAVLTTGQLSVRVDKTGPWLVEYRAGERLLTASGRQGLGFVDTPTGRYIQEQLNLDVGECVYGLGERFTPFVKNGQVVDIWNEDGGTSSEQAYKNIPFYLTNRGYGVLVNHPERVSFEVASEKVERVQFSVPGETLDYFIIYGPSPKAVLQRYTALTGRPALPPAWSFGLWLSTSFTTNYDEPTVTGFIEGMAARDLPLHVFHFDCFWMKEFHWCDFQWDERCFPDPAGMLQRLKARGLRICVWINPYIAQRSKLFDEAAAQGYLLKRPNGDVWQTDMWQAGLGIVDFTHPGARQWFAGKLRVLLEMGVDAFKTDFGERIPTDVVYHNQADPFRMHNYYTYLYNQTVFELLQDVRGAGEAVVFARSATVGGQRFPVHWGGDCTATFVSMAESLRGGLSLGLSGFGFWSHDIGGFEQTATAEVYKRWTAFGLLSSHSRLHGSSSYRVPWAYDDEAVEVLRFFTQLKCRLMPYLYRAALQSHQAGVPMLRAMVLEFPDDPACDYLDRQYMLGDSLLVAPVLSQDGHVTYYLPAGRWTSLLDGRVLEGPHWVRETHNFLSLPLWVRPNSVLPVGHRADRPDYDFSEAITLQIYQLAAGEPVQVEIPTLTGTIDTTFTVRRDGQVVEVERQGPPRPWKILLAGIASATVSDGAQASPSPAGALITAEAETDRLQVEIR